MNRIRKTLISLARYCEMKSWAGYDPYDALNSRVYACTPFFSNRICSVGLTQIMKRLPINLRPLLGVSKKQNPKGIALFLMAFLKLSKKGILDREDLIKLMIERLVALRSLHKYWCWGYSFPWQTRKMLVPWGTPNLVCTTFAANALLDAYELESEPRCLDMAVSAAEYLLNELYWTEGDSTAGFSYPLPSSRPRVHNANFLGSALLCRIYRHTGEDKFLGPALKVARYSAGKQHEDGSWDYGESPTQKWVDNFHTGYNLSALRSIWECAGISEFEPRIRKGFEFYRGHFFREDGAPRYFHNRTYPIDIHSVAQSIITLSEFSDLYPESMELAEAVYDWAMRHLWDERGYFYYQVLPFYTNRISYMRWSQAWMLLALSTLSKEQDAEPVGAGFKTAEMAV